MDFKLILSGRDKAQILHQGFRLKRNKGPNGPNKTTYWACVQVGCNARAATLGEINMTDLSLKYHYTEQHSHHADEAKNLVAEKLYEFRENAKKNPDKTAKSAYDKIVRDTVNSIDTPEKIDFASKLPKFKTVKDQHYRQRKKLRPKLPQSLEEVDIPSYADLKCTEGGHDFYRGQTPTTHAELFMSDAQIEIALESDTLFVDGTFSITPFPFYQVFVLRGKVGNNRYTIGTALLPNKREETYKELFQLMVDVVKDVKGEALNFTFVHSDCEHGIINAVKGVFPEAQPRLCRFHIVDAERRGFTKIGCRPLMKDHRDLKTFYTRIQQIFFFPPRLWPRTWKLIYAGLTQELKDHPLVQKFVDYLVS